jgi:hypothetical protein
MSEQIEEKQSLTKEGRISIILACVAILLFAAVLKLWQSNYGLNEDLRKAECAADAWRAKALGQPTVRCPLR